MSIIEPECFLRRFGPVLAAVLGLVLAGPVRGQEQEDGASGGKDAPAAAVQPSSSLEDELAAVSAELEAARGRLGADEANRASPEGLARSITLLEQLAALLSQRQAARAALEALQQELEDARRELGGQRSTAAPQPPPYTYLVLEGLRDQVRDERLRSERVASAVKVAQEFRAKAQSDFEAKERARRLVKEQYDANADTSKAATLANAMRAAELESRIAGQTAALRAAELELQEVTAALSEVRLQALEERLAYVADRAELTDEDRTNVALDLARREERLERATEAAQRALDYLGSQWLDAKRRLDLSPGDASLAEEVETLKQGQAYRRAELTALAERLQRINSMRTLWDRRFAYFQGGVSRSEIEDWSAESREALRELEVDVSLTSGHLTDARNDLVTLQGQASIDVDREIARWLSQRQSYLGALANVHEEDLASLELLRRLHLKLLDDIDPRRGKFDLWAAGSGVWESVLSVWRYELTEVEDRPITVGKIVTGLLLLFFGVVLSKAFSRFLGGRLLSRIRLDEGALHAIQSLLFYLLVVTFALIALRIVNVPLTAFTILGGALAIGFGFGSQNLVNNFISGLILLVERPIRASDLIQIDDLYGTVEYIGLRSTRIRTGENFEIIVPNSSFLQQNVVNWTLSDTRVRIRVAVGVAYGSPTRDVKEVLRKAAENHGRVLESPEPVVLFTNFGDNSLEFEVHFWIRMRSLMDRRLVESDLRFMIDSLCREAGIAIAFPQRDVHLDTLRPLDVRIVPDPEPTGEAPEPAGTRRSVN